MSYSFITELSESKLFPTKGNFGRRTPQEVAEILYLYLIAMRILFAEDETKSWAHLYSSRAIQFGKVYDKWRVNSNDLYILLHGLHLAQTNSDLRVHYTLRTDDITRWLRDMEQRVSDDTFEPKVQRLFLKMDVGLRITDSSMKAVRRLVMNWPDLEMRQKQLATTRLLQMLRKRAFRSELLPWLMRVARIENLEIKNVNNVEDELTESAGGAAWPAELANTDEILDYMEEHATDYFSRELADEYLGDARAVLKKVAVSSLTPGPAAHNAGNPAKTKRYLAMEPATMPPLVVEGGVVIDGNHRLRVAIKRGLQDVWIYDVVPADALSENATTGATSAASIAVVPGALGAGFDPNGDWGIYQGQKNKKDTKPVLLRRVEPKK